MKTTKALLLLLSIPAIIIAQNPPSLTPESLELTSPKFDFHPESKAVQTVHAFVLKNIDYSALVHAHHEGISVIEFKVSTTGRLSNFRVINKVSKDQIINQLKATNGLWTPGKMNGIPVAMHHEVAIKIVLNHDGSIRSKNNFDDIARMFYNKGVKKFLKKHNAQGAFYCFESALHYKPYDQSLLMMRALYR